MKYLHLYAALFVLPFWSLNASEAKLPEDIQKIMDKPKYEHSIWGLYVKDAKTGEILYDLNSNKLFQPGSTTKLFTVAALLHAYGYDYRFKTPVYATGKIQNGRLTGNLILVAQGDLTMGGRQKPGSDTIAYTKMDHVYANSLPDVVLTKENPLNGLNALANQVYQKGVREIQGDVLIDDNLFDKTEKRQMWLTPIFINENLIDLMINPGAIGQNAELTWRPQVPGYIVKNELKTVAKGEPLSIDISSDEIGHHIILKGTVPIDKHDLVRIFAIKDPSHFARAAFIQALRDQGIKVDTPEAESETVTPSPSYRDDQQVGLWTSPPLSEYGKLILKVSHNLGANLVPLLLAAKEGKKTYDEGMLLLGNYVIKDVKVSSDVFVFVDAAGGDDNRLSPQAEVQLLEYMTKQTPAQFKRYMDSLPILGVDGSLEDIGKGTSGVGKVYAKPGTGISTNLATGQFFLVTQALAGYIQGKNGHLLMYMVSVINGNMPKIEDIFPIFEDQNLISSDIYDLR